MASYNSATSSGKFEPFREPKRLYLSRHDKKVLGVCGGLAAYASIDTTLVRLAWLVVTILTGFFPGLIVYVIMAIITPKEPAGEQTQPLATTD